MASGLIQPANSKNPCIYIYQTTYMTFKLLCSGDLYLSYVEINIHITAQSTATWDILNDLNTSVNNHIQHHFKLVKVCNN